jgi:hypothetical protein
MLQLLKLLKRLLVLLLSVAVAYLTYLYLISFLLSSYRHNNHFVLMVIVVLLALWLFTAYMVLPAIHRLLVKIYLPDYFIGRSRTVDGLLGDPINLAVIGTKRELIKAMNRAGWTEAEHLTPFSSIKIMWHSITNRTYPNAPVSPLFLFGFKQDLVFQQEVNNSPRKRHHVRFWRTPEHWWMPGGYKADWLGAAVFDRTVGFSSFTLQFTHKIESDIDVERDFVVASLLTTGLVKQVESVEHYASGFRSRNGGGDRISTDGSLPFIHLT